MSSDAKIGLSFGVIIAVMVIVVVVLVLNRRRDQLPSALREAIMRDGTAGFSNNVYFSQESIERTPPTTPTVAMELPPTIDDSGDLSTARIQGGDKPT